jgi:hypothetical protein
MTPIKKLPKLNWTDNSLYEITEAGGDELLARSSVAFQITNVLVVGLIYDTLTNPPWLWFALSNDITFRDLIDFRRLKEHIPQGTLTAVAQDFAIAQRFAEFYGFEKTGGVTDFKGRKFFIYRRV